MVAPDQAKGATPLLYSGTALIIYLLGWLMPLPGIFLWVGSPLPLILLYWQRGLAAGRKGILLTVVAALVVFIIIGAPFGGLMFLFFMAIALVLGEAPGWNLKPDLALGLAALVATLVLIGAFALDSALFGPSLAEQLAALSAARQDALLQTYQNMGLDPAAAAELRDTVSKMLSIMVKLLIALWLMSALFTAWLNLIFGRVILRRMYGPEEVTDLGLCRWSAPDVLIWPLIASGLGVALSSGFWFWACLNVLTVLATVYFMQGVAVMVFWMDKRRVPGWVRIVIFTVLAVEIFLTLLVALAGIFDTWFDFRRLKAAESAD